LSITAFIEPTLGPGVDEYLREHHVEEAFRRVIEVLRDCFPEATRLEGWLLDDPDEEGRTWVVLQVTMPADTPPETLQARRLRYHQEMLSRLPLAHQPYFGFVLASEKETA
jgi:hypothetical protein